MKKEAKAVYIKGGNNIVPNKGVCSFGLDGANSHDLKRMLEGIGIHLLKLGTQIRDRHF